MLIVASSNAEKITDADIEAINQLAPKILEKSAKENKIENISKIFAIIWQNRKIEIKPILERIQISLVGGSGMKNRLRDIDYSGDLKPYQYIGAEFSIAILDEKERREKQTEIIKQKAEILKQINALKAFYDDYVYDAKTNGALYRAFAKSSKRAIEDAAARDTAMRKNILEPLQERSNKYYKI